MRQSFAQALLCASALAFQRPGSLNGPLSSRRTASSLALPASPASLIATAHHRSLSPLLSAATPAANKRSTLWGTLFGLCKPDAPLLAVAFGSLAVAAIGEALLPALQAAALNAVLYGAAPSGLRSALLRLGGTGLLTSLFTGIRGYVFWITGSRLVARLRTLLFGSLIRQPQAFHDEQGPGELSSRLATDCVKLGDVLTLNVNIVLRQVLQSVAGLAVVARLNGRLAGIVVAGVAMRAALSQVCVRL